MSKSAIKIDKRLILMSKSAIPSAPPVKKTGSGKVVKMTKNSSHGTYRCKRKPNSKRCK